jgi:hypothetical protein
VVAARATRRPSLTDVLWLRQGFISRILSPSGVCTQGGGEELLRFSVRIGLNETEGYQLRHRVILVLWWPRVAPLYYSPCAGLRIRLAKRRFNKLLKSSRTQLPVFYWAVGYIAISAILAPTILRPERGGAFLCFDWAAGQSSGQSENSPSEGGRGGVQTCCF